MAVIVTSTVGPLFAAERAQPVLGRTIYRSPDHRLVAEVLTIKQAHSYGTDPSLVEIRTADRHLLAMKDHSIGPGQGYTVDQAAWTADSRFFVYMVSNSGGHSPWHNPIFFYSGKRRQFYNLELVLATEGNGGGAITGGLTLKRPSTILTKGRYYGQDKIGLRTNKPKGDDSGDLNLSIDLRWLEPRLRQSEEDFK